MNDEITWAFKPNVKHDNNCRAVEAVYPDGSVLYFKTLSACAKAVGTSLSNLRNIKRKDGSFNGITFRDPIKEE